MAPALGLLDGIGSWVLLTTRTVTWAVRPPYRPIQLLKAMEFVGVGSVFIVSLTGIFSGMVLALQTVHSLRQFSAEGIVGAIVGGFLFARFGAQGVTGFNLYSRPVAKVSMRAAC